MSSQIGAPGFFGKLPSHGDFVGRGLPPQVRERFDTWLQAGLLYSRQALGADWRSTWLKSPMWRFIVAAGVCGEQAWSGVMMPSHDRVGRCFPLLLAAGSEVTPSPRACLTICASWFEQLEELALSTLADDFVLADFDNALLAMPGVATGLFFPARFASSEQAVAGCKSGAQFGRAEQVEALLVVESMWWSVDTAGHHVHPRRCTGLPPPTAFTAMLAGSGMSHV